MVVSRKQRSKDMQIQRQIKRKENEENSNSKKGPEDLPFYRKVGGKTQSWWKVKEKFSAPRLKSPKALGMMPEYSNEGKKFLKMGEEESPKGIRRRREESLRGFRRIWEKWESLF